MAPATAIRQGTTHFGWVQRAARWLEGVAHPKVAIEFQPDKLAGVRWTKSGTIANCVTERLPAGALMPSAIENNIANPTQVSAALATIRERLNILDEDVTLLLPDPVIRVFLQKFEDMPRSEREVLPMLRWKLKKSLPFEAEEAALSFMHQASDGPGVNVAIAVARQSIVREYETLAESAGIRSGVILSSSLASVALLQGEPSTLLARICGNALTTTIVRQGVLCFYRCTELPVSAEALTPQLLLEELYPVLAYYQDTAEQTIQSARLAGFGDRASEFIALMENELHCSVRPLLSSALADGYLPETARPLVEGELEAMAGWMLNAE